jgi:nucleoside-diphosphate-sugar epimerase
MKIVVIGGTGLIGSKVVACLDEEEYEGRSHLMPSQEGWEEIADYPLTWAVEHAVSWAAERTVPSGA